MEVQPAVEQLEAPMTTMPIQSMPKKVVDEVKCRFGKPTSADLLFSAVKSIYRGAATQRIEWINEVTKIEVDDTTKIDRGLGEYLQKLLLMLH